VIEDQRSHDRLFYKSIPKVDLHRHLEGSLRLSTMLEITRLHHLDLPFGDVDKFRSLVQVIDSDPFNFQNFLSKFATLRKFYQTPEAIKRIAREAIIDAASDNVRYLELRFTPVALTRIKDFPLAEAMDWVIQSVNEASNEFGVMTRLIASVNRHESVRLAEEVVQLAVDRKDNGVVGLDLAGSEAEYPGEEFGPIFHQAIEAGLGVTIHAGEWGGPEIIRMAIKTLNADRIGHGVRVLEDQETVELAKERQVVFEVCPTSNYQSGVVDQLDRHHLPRMIEADLICTLNTDDPGISQIVLSDEYKLASEVLKISQDGLKTLIINAVEAAFLPESEKNMLSKELFEELLIKFEE
jgi:adenosine deaminase